MSEKKPYTGSMLSGCMDFSESQPTDEAAVERARLYAKSVYCTPEEHDDIMVAVRLAKDTLTERQRAERAENLLRRFVDSLTNNGRNRPNTLHVHHDELLRIMADVIHAVPTKEPLR